MHSIDFSMNGNPFVWEVFQSMYIGEKQCNHGGIKEESVARLWSKIIIEFESNGVQSMCAE
jgi:hypothetical protein